MREPNRDETFSIKQAWRALQIDVQLRKQTRRLHKKSALPKISSGNPAPPPGVNPCMTLHYVAPPTKKLSN